MGQFGGYYKGERKRRKKSVLEKKAQILTRQQHFVLPKVEVISKGKGIR